MREKPEYRQTLKLISELNNGKAMVTLKKAAEIIGCDPRTLKSKVNFLKTGRLLLISTAALADWMVNHE